MVSRIYEYNHELFGENLPENYTFCIFYNGYLDEIINSNIPSTNSNYDVRSILFIYQTDLSIEDLKYLQDSGEVLDMGGFPEIINEFYPNNECIYIGQILISDGGGNEIILNENTTDVSLVINNKIVSNIINNSNNKIIDSISMNGNIIYQRQNDIHVNKIDTDFIYHTGIRLVDIDGNGLGGKEIKYQANYGNQLVTYTHITQENGYTYIDYLLGDPGLKCILFEGDEEYNSCLYENDNYKLPIDVIK